MDAKRCDRCKKFYLLSDDIEKRPSYAGIRAFAIRTFGRVHLMNWKFIIHWCRWNKKPFSKLHILIRTPLLCLERNNGGTAIGNKYVVWFIK